MKRTIFFAALLTGAVLAAAPPADDGQCLIGTNLHYGWDEGMIDESISLSEQGGHNAVRGGINWMVWAPDPGVPVDTGIFPSVAQRGGDRLPYRRSALDGLAALAAHRFVSIFCINGSHRSIGGRFPVTPEDRAAFAGFCRDVAREAKGKVRYYQIYNEWDGGHEMFGKDSGVANTPENYVKLLKEAAAAVRREDPSALILANPFCTGDAALFAAFRAGMLDECDAYAVHPYALTMNPEGVAERLEKVAAESAKYNRGVPKPFLISEMGWWTAPGGLSESACGDSIARLYLLLKTMPSFRGMTWYNFNERDYKYSNKGGQWGIVMPDMTPKEYFYSMRSVAPVVREGRFVREIPAPSGVDAKLLLFQMPDGRYVLAAWTPLEQTRIHFVLEKQGGWTQPLAFVRCGNPEIRRRWGFRDQSYSSRICGVAENPDQFSFHTTSRPVLIYGVPGEFKIVKAEVLPRPETEAKTAVVPGGFARIRRGKPETLVGDAAGLYTSFTGGKWGGKQDLSYRLSYFYDRECIDFTLDVADDVFFPVETGRRYWEGDSLQLALSVIENGKPFRDYREYTVALTSKGAVATLRTGTVFSGPTVAPATVERLDATHVRYRLRVPFAELGVSGKQLETGSPMLGFALAVNDNDGTGRKGAIRWADGIVTGGKDPSRYGWLLFE